MAEPLHLPEDTEPELEQIRLGGETLSLDPETARIVRDQFESLAAQYAASLENYQRQALQTIGTQQPPPQFQPPQPTGLEVPDPDLLFQNKGAWTENFQQSLESRLGQLEGRQTQLVQGAVSAFQQELNRRDQLAQVQARHDAAMAEMLDRRGLTENTLVVQAVYNREYDKLKHLPLELGLDKIGALAEQEIQKIRSGEQWTITPGNTPTGTQQRPPAMLRTRQRVQRAAPATAPAPVDQQQLASPGGGLGQMGMIIRKRQQDLLRSSA